jgi:2-polyprenyl-3-methyl-5-hydroxy-6-metoxy-1,4-benzoquinol methylase
MILLTLAFPASALSQTTPSDDAVWTHFVTWAKDNPTQGLRHYSGMLAEGGVSEAEVQRRLEVIRRLFSERPEGTELIYDRIYSKPLTGNPEEDGFNSEPSAFLIEATTQLAPGEALDVGAGQGRNAVYLATHGWNVTGIDISGAGLAAARANADKAGTRVSTVKTTYRDFDFGKDRWDLIAMILSWAPVEDPSFVEKLVDSLRPGGRVVFEHVIQKEVDPFPPNVHALAPEVLKEYFAALRIERYEEVTDLGDWGGPPARLVRMVARKQ